MKPTRLRPHHPHGSQFGLLLRFVFSRALLFYLVHCCITIIMFSSSSSSVAAAEGIDGGSSSSGSTSPSSPSTTSCNGHGVLRLHNFSFTTTAAGRRRLAEKVARRAYCDVDTGRVLVMQVSGKAVQNGSCVFGEVFTLPVEGGCGYLAKDVVQVLAEDATAVTLEEDGRGSTTSTDEGIIHQLVIGESWQPFGNNATMAKRWVVEDKGDDGDEAHYWCWNSSCELSMSGMPNLYHSCNNGDCVHFGVEHSRGTAKEYLPASRYVQNSDSGLSKLSESRMWIHTKACAASKTIQAYYSEEITAENDDDDNDVYHNDLEEDRCHCWYPWTGTHCTECLAATTSDDDTFGDNKNLKTAGYMRQFGTDWMLTVAQVTPDVLGIDPETYQAGAINNENKLTLTFRDVADGTCSSEVFPKMRENVRVPVALMPAMVRLATTTIRKEEAATALSSSSNNHLRLRGECNEYRRTLIAAHFHDVDVFPAVVAESRKYAEEASEADMVRVAWVKQSAFGLSSDPAFDYHKSLTLTFRSDVDGSCAREYIREDVTHPVKVQFPVTSTPKLSDGVLTCDEGMMLISALFHVKPFSQHVYNPNDASTNPDTFSQVAEMTKNEHEAKKHRFAAVRIKKVAWQTLGDTAPGKRKQLTLTFLNTRDQTCIEKQYDEDHQYIVEYVTALPKVTDQRLHNKTSSCASLWGSTTVGHGGDPHRRLIAAYFHDVNVFRHVVTESREVAEEEEQKQKAAEDGGVPTPVPPAISIAWVHEDHWGIPDPAPYAQELTLTFQRTKSGRCSTEVIGQDTRRVYLPVSVLPSLSDEQLPELVCGERRGRTLIGAAYDGVDVFPRVVTEMIENGRKEEKGEQKKKYGCWTSMFVTGTLGGLASTVTGDSSLFFDRGRIAKVSYLFDIFPAISPPKGESLATAVESVTITLPIACCHGQLCAVTSVPATSLEPAEISFTPTSAKLGTAVEQTSLFVTPCTGAGVNYTVELTPKSGMDVSDPIGWWSTGAHMIDVEVKYEYSETSSGPGPSKKEDGEAFHVFKFPSGVTGDWFNGHLYCQQYGVSMCAIRSDTEWSNFRTAIVYIDTNHQSVFQQGDKVWLGGFRFPSQATFLWMDDVAWGNTDETPTLGQTARETTFLNAIAANYSNITKDAVSRTAEVSGADRFISVGSRRSGTETELKRVNSQWGWYMNPGFSLRWWLDNGNPNWDDNNNGFNASSRSSFAFLYRWEASKKSHGVDDKPATETGESYCCRGNPVITHRAKLELLLPTASGTDSVSATASVTRSGSLSMSDSHSLSLTLSKSISSSLSESGTLTESASFSVSSSLSKSVSDSHSLSLTLSKSISSSLSEFGTLTESASFSVSSSSTLSKSLSESGTLTQSASFSASSSLSKSVSDSHSLSSTLSKTISSSLPAPPTPAHPTSLPTATASTGSLSISDSASISSSLPESGTLTESASFSVSSSPSKSVSLSKSISNSLPAPPTPVPPTPAPPPQQTEPRVVRVCPPGHTASNNNRSTPPCSKLPARVSQLVSHISAPLTRHTSPSGLAVVMIERQFCDDGHWAEAPSALDPLHSPAPPLIYAGGSSSSSFLSDTQSNSSTEKWGGSAEGTNNTRSSSSSGKRGGGAIVKRSVFDPFHYGECCAEELRGSVAGRAERCRKILLECTAVAAPPTPTLVETQQEEQQRRTVFFASSSSSSARTDCSALMEGCLRQYFHCVQEAAFEERIHAVRCGWASAMVTNIMAFRASSSSGNSGSSAEEDQPSSSLQQACYEIVETVLSRLRGGARSSSSSSMTTPCGDVDVRAVCDMTSLMPEMPPVAGGVRPDPRPSASASRPDGMDALVVRGDDCNACERAYYDGTCHCGAGMKVIRLRGYHSDMVYYGNSAGGNGVEKSGNGSSSNNPTTCYDKGFSFDMCLTSQTASNASDPRSISFYTGKPEAMTKRKRQQEQGFDHGDGEQVYDGDDDDDDESRYIGGDTDVMLRGCTTPHSATGACVCPEAMIPRPILHPAPYETGAGGGDGEKESSTAVGMDVTVTVFCAPAATTVHILHAETGACYNPLGVNVSCGCLPGSPNAVVPMAFINATSTLLSPGVLRFCSAAPQDAQVMQTLLTTLTLAASLAGAAAASGIQGSAALSLSVCRNDSSSSSSSSASSSSQRSSDGMLVPFSIGDDPLTSGMYALWICVCTALLVQGFAVAVVYGFYACRSSCSTLTKKGGGVKRNQNQSTRFAKEKQQERQKAQEEVMELKLWLDVSQSHHHQSQSLLFPREGGSLRGKLGGGGRGGDCSLRGFLGSSGRGGASSLRGDSYRSDQGTSSRSLSQHKYHFNNPRSFLSSYNNNNKPPSASTSICYQTQMQQQQEQEAASVSTIPITVTLPPPPAAARAAVAPAVNEEKDAEIFGEAVEQKGMSNTLVVPEEQEEVVAMAFNEVMRRLRFPGLAVGLSLLAVQGAVIEAGRLLVDGTSVLHRIVGFLGMLSVILAGVFLLWNGRVISKHPLLMFVPYTASGAYQGLPCVMRKKEVEEEKGKDEREEAGRERRGTSTEFRSAWRWIVPIGYFTAAAASADLGADDRETTSKTGGQQKRKKSVVGQKSALGVGGRGGGGGVGGEEGRSVLVSWGMWSTMYGGAVPGLMGWDPSEMFVTATVLGLYATLSARAVMACRILGVAIALLFVCIIALYVWKRPVFRRPMNTALLSVMHAVKALLALRGAYFARNVHDLPFQLVIVAATVLLLVINCCLFLLETLVWRSRQQQHNLLESARSSAAALARCATAQPQAPSSTYPSADTTTTDVAMLSNTFLREMMMVNSTSLGTVGSGGLLLHSQTPSLRSTYRSQKTHNNTRNNQNHSHHPSSRRVSQMVPLATIADIDLSTLFLHHCAASNSDTAQQQHCDHQSQTQNYFAAGAPPHPPPLFGSYSTCQHPSFLTGQAGTVGACATYESEVEGSVASRRQQRRSRSRRRTSSAISQSLMLLPESTMQFHSGSDSRASSRASSNSNDSRRRSSSVRTISRNQRHNSCSCYDDDDSNGETNNTYGGNGRGNSPIFIIPQASPPVAAAAARGRNRRQSSIRLIFDQQQQEEEHQHQRPQQQPESLLSPPADCHHGGQHSEFPSSSFLSPSLIDLPPEAQSLSNY